MSGKWMLICYGELCDGEVKGELKIELLPDLVPSLKLVQEKYYAYESHLIGARNFNENGVDVDFVVFNRTTQENVAEIEFWPKGYMPTPMSDVLNQLEDLECTQHDVDIDKAM